MPVPAAFKKKVIPSSDVLGREISLFAILVVEIPPLHSLLLDGINSSRNDRKNCYSGQKNMFNNELLKWNIYKKNYFLPKDNYRTFSNNTV